MCLLLLNFIFLPDDDVKVVFNGTLVTGKFSFDSVLDPGFCYIKMLNTVDDHLMGKFHYTHIHPADHGHVRTDIDQQDQEALGVDDTVSVSTIPPEVPAFRPTRTRSRPAYFAESSHSRGRNVRHRVLEDDVSLTSAEDEEVVLPEIEEEQIPMQNTDDEVIMLDLENMTYDQVQAFFGDGTENQWRMTVDQMNGLPCVMSAAFQCPVCLEEFNNHETRSLSGCGHFMCYGCTTQCIMTQNKCPSCRSPFHRPIN